MKELSLRRREPLESYGGWVKVATAPNQHVAGMMDGALRDRGIPVLDKKIGLDFPTSPSNQHAIMVPEDRVEEARELLEGIWDIGGC